MKPKVFEPEDIGQTPATADQPAEQPKEPVQPANPFAQPQLVRDPNTGLLVEMIDTTPPPTE